MSRLLVALQLYIIQQRVSFFCTKFRIYSFIDKRNLLVKDNKWFNPIEEKIDFINKKGLCIRLKCQK